MSVSVILHEMLARVAQALGEELRNEMVFVGGCFTSLLITDDFTRENVRHTDDDSSALKIESGTVQLSSNTDARNLFWHR